jgi:membrane protein DedA with SNARE-associated domain
MGIPIPSEVLIPVATILAEQGRFNIWLIFIIGVGAQLVGGLLSYWIGKKGGLPAVERFGSYVLISKDDIKRTHDVFAKYGRWMVAVGRCIPIIRGLIGYPAGIAEMPIDQFILWTTLGSAIWTGLLIYLGYVLNQHLATISSVMDKFSVAIIILLVAGIAYHIYRSLNHEDK